VTLWLKLEQRDYIIILEYRLWSKLNLMILSWFSLYSKIHRDFEDFYRDFIASPINIVQAYNLQEHTKNKSLTVSAMQYLKW